MNKIEYVDIATAVPTEKLRKNILDASKLDIKPINVCPDWREGRAIALIGGGPSLSNYLNDLGQYETTIACGSVHNYLVENNVIPKYCLIVDADPIMVKYIDKPSPFTKYLVASQCSKEVFEELKYREIYLWHATGPKEFNEIFQGNNNTIPGGCTVGTRAILAAIGMGYKNIHLYGFDSCIREDKHHAYEFMEPENEQLGDITHIRLDDPDSPIFQVAGYMLAQFFDFQGILKVYAGMINIEVFGGGLLAEALKIGKLTAKKLEEAQNGISY